MKPRWTLFFLPILYLSAVACEPEGPQAPAEPTEPSAPAEPNAPAEPPATDQTPAAPGGAGPVERPATNGGAATAMPPQGEQEQDATAPQVDRAVCVLISVGDSGVQGVVEFARQGDGKIKITGEVSGLEPGKHGFHVHQFGDLTDLGEGESAGDHFAGDSPHHGAPDADQRHVGDLGNIEANEQGVARIDMTDDVIALSGPNSILGRALVVHADPDDFSQPSGGAGGRVAFGVIGMAEQQK